MAQPAETYPPLLSLAVHELRTPAGITGGYLRMLRGDTDRPLSERQQKMAEEAERSCARIVALVSQLEEIARFDAGALDLAREAIDPFLLAREASTEVEEAAERGVRVETRCDAAGAAVPADARRLRAALASVLRAIVREQPGPGLVVVDCRLDPRAHRPVATIVIGEERRIAGAASAGQVPFDERRGGLGLAIPLARRVIEASGGRLTSPDVADGRRVAVIAFHQRL
jgi:K+-sensing histidine kinase KdpD